MTNEEQVLAAIEEISNQLNDLKKTINRPANNVEVDLSPISNKIDSIKEQLQKIASSSNSLDSDSKRIFDSLRNLQDLFVLKQREVLHRYIEIKKPQQWIIGVGVFFVLSIATCFFFISRNIKLREAIEASQPNDIMYRYIKLKGFELSGLRKNITNTTELVYSLDQYYEENKKDIQDYVLKTEEDIRIAFEASEIAKQKESEAKMARDKAIKLKGNLNK
jgi:hypothetical protein